MGKIVIGLSVVLFSSFLIYEQAKKTYFNLVLSSCQKYYGLENIHWHRVPAFDAQVHYFFGANKTEISVIKCARKWAGIMVIVDAVEIDADRPNVRAALVRTISGQNYNPPEENFYFRYIEYIDVNVQNIENEK